MTKHNEDIKKAIIAINKRTLVEKIENFFNQIKTRIINKFNEIQNERKSNSAVLDLIAQPPLNPTSTNTAIHFRSKLETLPDQEFLAVGISSSLCYPRLVCEDALTTDQIKKVTCQLCLNILQKNADKRGTANLVSN